MKSIRRAQDAVIMHENDYMTGNTLELSCHIFDVWGIWGCHPQSVQAQNQRDTKTSILHLQLFVLSVLHQRLTQIRREQFDAVGCYIMIISNKIWNLQIQYIHASNFLPNLKRTFISHTIHLWTSLGEGGRRKKEEEQNQWNPITSQ